MSEVMIKNEYQQLKQHHEMMAKVSEMWEWYQRNKIMSSPYRFKPRTLDQLIEILTQEKDQSKIYLTISHFKPGLTLRGNDYSNIPTSIMAILRPAPRSGSGGHNNQHVVYKSMIEADAVVQGFSSIHFEIKKDLKQGD